MTDTTEAADLARTILAGSAGERPADLVYTLTAREARTLANAALAADRVEALADLWESVVSSDDYEAAMQNAATDLRDALNGEQNV